MVLCHLEGKGREEKGKEKGTGKNKGDRYI
jgi:hypothetical protein